MLTSRKSKPRDPCCSAGPTEFSQGGLELEKEKKEDPRFSDSAAWLALAAGEFTQPKAHLF